MRVFWDASRIGGLEKKVDRLERKIDDGFAAIRSEHRADFRMLIGLILSMFLAMILGFAGILVAVLIQSA